MHKKATTQLYDVYHGNILESKAHIGSIEVEVWKIDFTIQTVTREITNIMKIG